MTVLGRAATVFQRGSTSYVEPGENGPLSQCCGAWRERESALQGLATRSREVGRALNRECVRAGQMTRLTPAGKYMGCIEIIETRVMYHTYIEHRT